MARPWYQSVLEVGREVLAVASHLEFGDLPSQPEQPKGTVIIAPGFSSTTRFYYPLARYWRLLGFETFFSESLLKHGFMFPQFPHDIYRFQSEILARKHKNRPLIIVAHSLGGLCSAGVYGNLVGIVDRLIILGTPFRKDAVYPTLINAVEKTCGLSLMPPCEIVTKIINFVRDSPQAVFRNILSVTVEGDPIAPPEAGGLPRTLQASYSPQNSRSTHSCLIFDSEILKLAHTFATMNLGQSVNVLQSISRRHPRVRFSHNEDIPHEGDFIDRVAPEKVIHTKKNSIHTKKTRALKTA